MLLLAISWIYITCVAMGWGKLFSDLVNRCLPAEQKHFPDPMMLCLAGISITGWLAFSLSIITPMNGWMHLIICAPAIFYLFTSSENRNFFSVIRAYFSAISWPGLLLLGTGLLMIAILNASPVVHPDTLMYHAQSIKWMEQFPSVPGLAHLSNELGMQSLFFANHALFRFQFIRTSDAIFLNGCMAAWFIIFLVANSFKKSDSLQLSKFLPSLLLLAFTLLSWTQLRLTAASASPDFIVTIYLLAIFWLYLSYAQTPSTFHPLLFCILFIATAIATKLSAAPIAIFAVVILTIFIKKDFRKLFYFSLLAAGLAAITLMIKNGIASGFLFYPMTMADILQVDWKMDTAIVNDFRKYIFDYAILSDTYNASAAMGLSFPGWIKIWWAQVSIPDKLILAAIPPAMALNLSRLIGKKTSHPTSWWMAFLVSLTGAMVWFVNAPAFRFGSGFLFPLLFLNLPWHLFRKMKPYPFLARISAIILFLAVGVYSVIRLTADFRPEQYVYPAGLTLHPVTQVECEGQSFTQTEQFCGFANLPCIHTPCDKIKYRGGSLREGFRAR